MAHPAAEGFDFRICGDLACDLGVAITADLIQQLRARYPRPALHPLVLYLLLPDASAATDDAPGTTRHAEAFAVLQKVNYLALDETTALHPRADDVAIARKDTPRSLELCHLILREASSDRSVDHAAELLWQGAIRPGAGAEQIDLLDFFLAGKGLTDRPNVLGGAWRSRRFASVATTRIVYPEWEIREHLTATLVVSAANALRYGNWAEGVGYVSSSGPGPDWRRRVRERELLGEWMLTSHHLQLQLPLDPTDKSSRLFSAWWMDVTHGLDAEYQRIIRATEQDQLPRDVFRFYKLGCARAFERDFRGMGVSAFDDAAADDQHRLAELIIARLESWARRQLRGGATSVAELLAWGEALEEALSARIQGIPKQIEAIEAELRADEAIEMQLCEVDEKLPHRSPIANWLPGAHVGRERAKLYRHIREHFASRYARRTLQAALKFEAILLEVLCSRFETAIRAPLHALDDHLARTASETSELMRASGLANPDEISLEWRGTELRVCDGDDPGVPLARKRAGTGERHQSCRRPRPWRSPLGAGSGAARRGRRRFRSSALEPVARSDRARPSRARVESGAWEQAQGRPPAPGEPSPAGQAAGAARHPARGIRRARGHRIGGPQASFWRKVRPARRASPDPQMLVADKVTRIPTSGAALVIPGLP
jgi:hypothetical protein